MSTINTREIKGGIYPMGYGEKDNITIDECFHGLGYLGNKCLWVVTKEEELRKQGKIGIVDYVSSEEYWNRYFRGRSIASTWCLSCCDATNIDISFIRSWQALCEDRVNDGIIDEISLDQFFDENQFYFMNRDYDGYILKVNCSLEKNSEKDQNTLIGYNLTLHVLKQKNLASYWRSVTSCEATGVYHDYKDTQFGTLYDIYDSIEIINLEVSSATMMSIIVPMIGFLLMTLLRGY
eukprot:snap_masked-scaffold_4-processed-gene-6.19-mRNA-1 protein AED:1.00 eAED:1.00 QI:0/0/0/0/1/1/2/0/235